MKRAKRITYIRSLASRRLAKHFRNINGTKVANKKTFNRRFPSGNCIAFAVGPVTVSEEVAEFAPGVTEALDMEQVGRGLGPDTAQVS